MDIGAGRKKNEKKKPKKCNQCRTLSKHLCFVFFNPHTFCNPCTPTYTYIIYTCTIYSPKTTSGCIHTRLVHENPPTRTSSTHAHTYTHTLIIDTTRTLARHSFTRSHSLTYKLLLQRRKEKMYFPSSIFF